MAYPTLQEIKDFIGIVGVDDDAYLTVVREAVIDAIEQYCQRKFEKAADSDTFLELNFENHVYVSRFPLDTVSLVEVNDSALTTDDYQLHQKTGLVLLDSKVTGKVKVDYNGGFDPIPGTISHLIYAAVKDAYSSKDADSSVGSVKSERVDGAVTLAYFSPDASGEEMGSVRASNPLIARYAHALDPYMSEKAVGGAF